MRSSQSAAFRTMLVAVLVLTGLARAFPASDGALASDAPPVRLSGHVLGSLATARRLGALDANRQLTLTVALRPSSSTAVQNAVRQAAYRGGPAQPPFQPTDVARVFGQPDANVAVVAQYFRSRGFQVASVRPDHLSFQMTGSVAEIEQALSVDLGSYADNQGHQFFATATDPALPANVAGYVQAIFGLDNYPVFRPLRSSETAPVPGQYRPIDLQTAYNVTPLDNQGWTGAGQTIGIIGCDAFLLSDIESFRQQFNLPSASVTTANVDGGPDGTDPETTLDLEWSGAIATGAALRLYGFPSSGGGCSFQGIFDAVAQATTENVASVMSISLGGCEATTPPDLGNALENQFAVAVTQQIGIFVASGDQGAFTCPSNISGGFPTVSYPASSPNVVSVGGTSLQLTSASNYESEAAWGDLCGGAQPCGGGGGYSVIFGEPPWQSQANIPDGTAARAVPDIALDADPATGYVIEDTMAGSGCSGRCGVGGTSVASPEWAGLAAIANQAAGHRLGLLTPLLYSSTIVGAEGSSNPPYHDVTSGNNLFYNAAAGWDPATGWGSPNANNLVRLLAATGSPCESAQLLTRDNAVGSGFFAFLPYVSNQLPPTPTATPVPTATPAPAGC